MEVLDEDGRLAALEALGVLDTPAEAAFDRLTALAAELFAVPISMITLVDRHRQWFKSRFGIPVDETPRELSFCAHTILGTDVLVVEDARLDPRFSQNPAVVSQSVRFYAGAPLISATGMRIGAFGISDLAPRAFSLADQRLLEQFAAVAMDEIALRALIRSQAGGASHTTERAALNVARQLRFVTEQLPAILWTTDRDLIFTSAMGAGLRALGRTPADLVGSRFIDFVASSPDGWRNVAAHRAALEGRGSSTDVWFGGRAYRTRVDPLRDDEGRPSGTIGVALDITDRAESEEAVRQSEERYRMIAQATNDVVRDWDIATGEVIWNDSVAVAFRVPRREVGATFTWWSERIHRADRERVLTRLHCTIASDAASWSEEYRFQRADGSYARVLDRGVLSRNPAGKAVRMIASMLDVTEGRAIEGKLIQAERLASMGTLAAGMAHEINNPLTYVMANVGFVSERLSKLAQALPEEAGKHPGHPQHALAQQLVELAAALAEAQEGAVRVRQIVRDLKVFSRGGEERENTIEVKGVLESSLSMVWNEIRHRARVVRDFGPIPTVEASESKLGQVFLNLLINAAQAIVEGNVSANEIRIATATDELGRAVVTISDTGAGIPPDVLQRIFDPFFTTKPIGVGTGLGLFICHGIVKGLGGDISVESEVGKGTRFRVALPAAQLVPASSASAAGGAGERPGGSRRRVLLVDDEVNLASGLERALSGEHDVVLATSGREAKAILARDDHFDVVLCDLMMPDVTGMEVFAYIKAERPKLADRTVFMTGGAFTAGARTFLEEVTNRRIEKPFDLDRLRALIREFPGPERA